MASLEVQIKPAWQNVVSENGDVDVLPLGENHTTGAGCICNPRIEIIGANLIIVHGSFDKREFIERAIAIMNGEDE